MLEKIKFKICSMVKCILLFEIPIFLYTIRKETRIKTALRMAGSDLKKCWMN